MKNDPFSTFQSPKFKKVLQQYKEMKEQGLSTYFEAEDLTMLAEYYLNNGNVKESENVLKYASSLHPDNLDIKIYQCHSLIANQKKEEAKRLLDTLSDPFDYEVKLLRAELLLLDNEKESADYILNTLYEEEPIVDVMLDLAQTYLEVHYPQQAYYWIDKILKQEPDNMEATEMMASYHYSYGSPETAAHYYDRLLDEYPYTIEFWQNLTRCYLRSENPEKALDSVEFSLAIDEKNLISWELKANCYIMLEDVDKALDCFLYIEENAKDKTYIRQYILQAYHTKFIPEKMIEYAQLLLNERSKLSNEEIADVLYKKAIAQLEEDSSTATWQTIREGLSYNNHNPELYILKGELHLQEQAPEKAEEAFRQALHFTDHEEDTQKSIGIAYMRNNLFVQAYRKFYTAVQSNPDQPASIYFYLAYCCFREEALQHTIFTCVARKFEEFVKVAEEDRFEIEFGITDFVFTAIIREIIHKIQTQNINLEDVKKIALPDRIEDEDDMANDKDGLADDDDDEDLEWMAPLP